MMIKKIYAYPDCYNCYGEGILYEDSITPKLCYHCVSRAINDGLLTDEEFTSGDYVLLEFPGEYSPLS